MIAGEGLPCPGVAKIQVGMPVGRDNRAPRLLQREDGVLPTHRVDDRKVQQGFYPSRVMIARK